MSNTCALWKCDNPRKDGFAYCEDHPPLVDHGLAPNETVCPKCGKKGMGTIHDDLWYCLDDNGYNGCGELWDPYKLADVEKETKW
jgi:hypothetical protein